MAPFDPELEAALNGYAVGAFPMDDDDADELPWFTTPERAVFELDEASRDRLRRKLRRDLRACSGYHLRVDTAYDAVLSLCAQPPEGEGQWITPRLEALYRRLHAAGFSHSFELWTPEGELAAGILGVVLGRAALLESMRRRLPSAGNALLSRTLDHLAGAGIELCDIQMSTPHTARLGCVEISQDEFERRLAHSLRQGDAG